MPEIFDTDGQECARIAKTTEWSRHPLGSLSEWPRVLVTTLNTLLNSRHPQCLFWGASAFYFYNDGYIPILGPQKHPWALGRPGAEVWAEVWPMLIPQIEQVRSQGRATWNVDHLVPIVRGGAPEDAYFTYSYSPVFDDAGSIVGTLVTCSETTERVHAQRALQERETNLQLALDSARMGTWQVDLRTGIATASAETSALYGSRNADTFRIEDASQFVHPDDLASVERTWLDCVAANRLYSHEFRIQRPDGEVRWIHSRGTTRHSPTGEPLHFSGIVLDITEARRSEIALRESEARFEQICEAPPLLVWTARPDGRCDYLSRQWLQYTGRGKSSELGLKWLVEALVEEDRPLSLATLTTALEKQAPFDAEHRLVRADGTARWFKTRATPILDAQRGVTHWFGTCTDIEDTKQAQIRYERDVDTSPAILWITGPDGTCSYLSQQWYAHTGQVPGEGLGFGWLEAVHPDDRERAGAVFVDANTRRVPFRTDYRLRVAGGAYRWAIDAGNPRFGTAGEYLGFAGTVLDIHERVVAEAELEAALRARDEFLSIASHELKTPLTSLKLQAQLHERAVRKGDPQAFAPDRVEDIVRQTSKQVARLNRLVDDMLDVARIRTGNLSLEVEPFDLGALAEEVVARLKEQFLAAGYEIPRVARGGDTRGTWDPVRIEQVITNLLTNALRYGNRKAIGVTVASVGGLARLVVSDLGIGIAEDAKAKIFDRFERAVNANEVSGLGLGLFISRQIVAAHGGSIRVESGLGEGSNFVVEIPKEPPGGSLRLA